MIRTHTMFGRHRARLLALAACAALSACGQDGRGANEQSAVIQTRFPGQVTAGGPTSGTVMAQAKPGDANAGQNASPSPRAPATAPVTDPRQPSQPSQPSEPAQEAVPAAAEPQSEEQGQGDQTSQSNVSGTPGIPEGAGGTPSGAVMGGTTPRAAASQVVPPGQSPEAIPPAQGEITKEKALSAGEKEKIELARTMDRVADRWRNRAQEKGAQMQPAVGVDQLPGAEGVSGPDRPNNVALPIRSEKLGTAPPSEDVKDPAKKGK